MTPLVNKYALFIQTNLSRWLFKIIKTKLELLKNVQFLTVHYRANFVPVGQNCIGAIVAICPALILLSYVELNVTDWNQCTLP